MDGLVQAELEDHHQGEDACNDRRDHQGQSHIPADLPVGVCGHAEEQDESDNVAHDRAVYQESGEAGEEDEATCRETQPWFYPRRPFSQAADGRTLDDQCDPDTHSCSHDSCGQDEAVVHWACPVYVGRRNVRCSWSRRERSVPDRQLVSFRVRIRMRLR